MTEAAVIRHCFKRMRRTVAKIENAPRPSVAAVDILTFIPGRDRCFEATVRGDGGCQALQFSKHASGVLRTSGVRTRTAKQVDCLIEQLAAADGALFHHFALA